MLCPIYSKNEYAHLNTNNSWKHFKEIGVYKELMQRVYRERSSSKGNSFDSLHAWEGQGKII